ncbi:MAG: hypothetical protein CUN53_09315, partial [Phototrophicales bacterium]
MKRISFLVIFAVAFMMSVSMVSAQPVGLSVTCDNGASFENGVEVIVNQMRTGFTYRATAVGIGGFDPVLAV